MKTTNSQEIAIDADFPVAEVIYSSEQIASAMDVLATHLNDKLANKNPVVLCVMNGGLIFTGHLLTRCSFSCELDYIHATRYRNTTQGSDINWVVYPTASLKGRHVLILDDILDEGVTMLAIKDYCLKQGAIQVDMAVLVKKSHDRCCLELDQRDYALTVEDKYVFGFGMDYEGKFRHLNAIFALQE